MVLQNLIICLLQDFSIKNPLTKEQVDKKAIEARTLVEKRYEKFKLGIPNEPTKKQAKNGSDVVVCSRHFITGAVSIHALSTRSLRHPPRALSTSQTSQCVSLFLIRNSYFPEILFIPPLLWCAKFHDFTILAPPLS